MALLGTAALAMWWDVTIDVLEEFEDWHSHEHFVERLGIPGFLRASRWKAGAGSGGIFVMYELADHGVLSSPAYLERLNAPTPWSTKMMPHHHGMVRSQCRVLATRGGAVAGHAVTARLAAHGVESGRGLSEAVARVVVRPGVAGAHLLRHERPAIAQTTEQKIRGSDREADWVLVATGYDADALADAVRGEMPTDAPPLDIGRYRLAHSAVPGDIA